MYVYKLISEAVKMIITISKEETVVMNADISTQTSYGGFTGFKNLRKFVFIHILFNNLELASGL